jgi:RimJ/RimL family protein N-acetyltransferase
LPSLGVPEPEPTDGVIADARSDELLGATGVHHVDWHNRRLETGYWIAPWARRRGIGTRGLRVLADWVLGPFGFGRIELVADVENVASQRLADAAGFEREGRLRAYLQDRDGVRRDVFMFSRTRSASGGAGSP